MQGHSSRIAPRQLVSGLPICRVAGTQPQMGKGPGRLPGLPPLGTGQGRRWEEEGGLGSSEKRHRTQDFLQTAPI